MHPQVKACTDQIPEPWKINDPSVISGEAEETVWLNFMTKVEQAHRKGRVVEGARGEEEKEGGG